MKLAPAAHYVSLGPNTGAAVTPWAPPSTRAHLSLYRATLRGLLTDLLHIAVAIDGQSPEWNVQPLFRGALDVPVESRLEFTADGWARLRIHIAPSAPERPRKPVGNLAAGRHLPAQLPFRARICNALLDEQLVLEWHLPAPFPPHLRPQPAAGAAMQSAGRQVLTLHLSADIVTACESVAESGPVAPRPAPRRGRPARRLTVHRVYRDSTPVPALRLSGHWLSQLGFTRGQAVSVVAEAGRIVLAVADAAGGLSAPAVPAAPLTDTSQP